MDRPATSRPSDSALRMGESGGEKMGKAGPAGPAKREKDDIAALKREAARLRKELKIEQERAQRLEDTNLTVTSRLSKAIASIRELLERQG